MASLIRRATWQRFLARRTIAPTPLVSVRPLSESRFALNTADEDKKKSLLNKDAINTETDEYSKTGTDNQAANTQGAFETNNNDPDAEKDEVNKNSENSPGGQKREALDGSPANSGMSKPKEEQR